MSVYHSIYTRLRRNQPDSIYRFFFDVYERDRWERAVGRAWFRMRLQ